MGKSDQDQPKWTEVELLPEWEEPFYDVYTAKKFGRWLMLKTLKPEYSENEECRNMLEKEFDVRYNLAHPNIIMINDLEEVPGIGRCIITDDVYGDSLRKLLDSGKVDETTLEKVTTSLIDAMSYIQKNHLVHHRIRPETIIFTENVGNLKLIDVGFDQLDHLSHDDTAQDIYDFGVILNELLSKLPKKHPQMQRVADRCMNPDPRRRYHDVYDLRMALTDRSNQRLYIIIISFLVVMIAILTWLNIHPR